MKFNKDTFLNEISERIQNAIDKGVVQRNPNDPSDTKSLEGFVQYTLLDYVKDRAFSIDVLKNISIDERKTFHEWEEEFGEIKSLVDLALIDLYLFLKASDLINYDTFSQDNKQKDKPMLNMIHSIEKEDKALEPGAGGTRPEDGGDMFDNIDEPGSEPAPEISEPREEPRRRMRFVANK